MARVVSAQNPSQCSAPYQLTLAALFHLWKTTLLHSRGSACQYPSPIASFGAGIILLKLAVVVLTLKLASLVSLPEWEDTKQSLTLIFQLLLLLYEPSKLTQVVNEATSLMRHRACIAEYNAPLPTGSIKCPNTCQMPWYELTTCNTSQWTTQWNVTMPIIEKLTIEWVPTLNVL